MTELFRVPLRLVDWRDRRFTFSRGGDADLLEDSIRKVGLLDPPELLRDGRRFIIIRGSRRLRALRRLRAASVQARVFDTDEVTLLEAWSRNFFDTRSVRELNAAESCTVLRQLTDLGVQSETILQDYLPLLGLPRRRRTLTEGLEAAALEEKILDALAEGGISLPTAIFLASLSASDRRAAFRFLRRRPLTVSQQREWSRLSADLAALKGTTVAAVLASASWASGKRPGSPGSTALQVLRERRYPTLSEHRRSFRKLVSTMRLPPWFQVDTHPFFERGELNVRFSAKDRASWESARRLLEKIDEYPDLTNLLLQGKDVKKGR